MPLKQGLAAIWIKHFKEKRLLFQIPISPEHFGTLFERNKTK
jgi:hypothetical protein